MLTVLDLCDCVHACLLWNEQGCGRPVKEGICLRLRVNLGDHVCQLLEVGVCLYVHMLAALHCLWGPGRRRACGLLPSAHARTGHSMR